MGNKIEIPRAFRDGTADEQLDYISELWGLIRDTPDRVSVPAWHRDVVRDRLQRAETTPPKTAGWEEVKRQLPSFGEDE